MKNRLLLLLLFALLAAIFYVLGLQGVPGLRLSDAHTLWDFGGLACVILALQQVAALGIRGAIRWRGGPEGEVRMLQGFTVVCAVFAVLCAFIYSLGLLKAIGAVAAGFAGMLLGWSLQAPVSGLAAWILVTLKRPFRVGDRVLFPSLGLLGDAKQIGVMYTVLDQVGGAVGSEEAIGRDILIPNAMLFNQVAINYTPKAQAAYFLDEVVIRITYDSDWDEAEKIMLAAAEAVTGDIIRATGEHPYIRSDIWDYGILMRLRYMTMAKDRPRITHEIIKRIFKAVQRNPRVDMAIPFVYSFRKSTDGVMRGQLPGPDAPMREIPVAQIEAEGLDEARSPEDVAEAQALARNIQEHGLLQPILVTPGADGHFRVIAGHKRFLACRQLGWKSVPVVVRPATATPVPPTPEAPSPPP